MMSVNTTAPALWAQHVGILTDRAIPVEYAKKVGLASVDLRKVREYVEKTRTPGPFPYLPLHRTTGWNSTSLPSPASSPPASSPPASSLGRVPTPIPGGQRCCAWSESARSTPTVKSSGM